MRSRCNDGDVGEAVSTTAVMMTSMVMAVRQYHDGVVDPG
jgi:hypothetical protein